MNVVRLVLNLSRRRRWAVAIGLLAALGRVPAVQAQARPVSLGPRQIFTAFVHVAVVPMDRERVLQDRTVLVHGSQISEVGASGHVAIPAGAVVIDGHGKFLIPGLADMHAHFDEKELFPYLANGVTTLREPGIGHVGQLEQRARIARGEVVGPRLYVGGGYRDASPQAAVQGVSEVKAEGYDNIKLPVPDVPLDVYDSIVAAARRVKLKIVGHVQWHRGVEGALHDRWASIEHLTGYVEYVVGLSGRWSLDAGRLLTLDYRRLLDTAVWMRSDYEVTRPIRLIAEATRRAGVWNCPTLTVNHVAPDSDEAIPPAFRTPEGLAAIQVFRRISDLQLRITKGLQEAGAGLLLGTDQDAFAIHRELQLLVRAGLTPYQALATGTRNVAVFLGTIDSTGTIAAGKRADLVLLDGNPLDDIRVTAGPAGVMVGGRWIPRTVIDARLEALGLQARRDEVWRRP